MFKENQNDRSTGKKTIMCTKLVGTYLSGLLLRTLVVGRRQQSESIEAALDME